MSDKNNELEAYLLRKMLEIDSTARKSRGSGSTGLDIADLVCKDFYVEAKQKHTKENIVADRKKELEKLKSEVPVASQKEPIWAYENKYGERYILLEAETFFRLLKKIKE
jgi:hypothetical protein